MLCNAHSKRTFGSLYKARGSRGQVCDRRVSVTNLPPRPSCFVMIFHVRITTTLLSTRNRRFCSMKILVLPKPREGVSREELLSHAAAEIQAVWELYTQGICREFYTRVNEPGRVVLMFESASMEAAKEALDTLPFAQLHLVDFDLIPLTPFTGLSRLFQAASEERAGQRSQ